MFIFVLIFIHFYLVMMSHYYRNIIANLNKKVLSLAILLQFFKEKL